MCGKSIALPRIQPQRNVLGEIPLAVSLRQAQPPSLTLCSLQGQDEGFLPRSSHHGFGSQSYSLLLRTILLIPTLLTAASSLSCMIDRTRETGIALPPEPLWPLPLPCGAYPPGHKHLINMFLL